MWFLFYTGLCFVKRTRPVVLREDRWNLQMEWKNRLLFSADFENRELVALKQHAFLRLRDSLTDRQTKTMFQTLEIKVSVPLLRKPIGRIEHNPCRSLTLY
jgi:hypothetical protein